MTQAVILAGGKGTRLAEQLRGRPKCLIEIDGVPLLQRQISLLKLHGIDDVVILVNHAADQVEQFLDRNGRFGIRIRSIDDGLPRGTAGAVLAALDMLADRFVVLYGDTLINVDLTRLMAAHIRTQADATLFLHPNDHPSDSDLVEMDRDGWIRAFHPYPHPAGSFLPNLVNAALYVIEKRALSRWRSFSSPSDFGKNLFPAMLDKSAKLRGYNSFEYIKDVGTPKRLAQAETQWRSGMVARASLAHKQKAVFLDRDGTLNVHRGFVRSSEMLELFPDVAEAIKRLRQSEFRTVIITNQPVIARGEASFEDMRHIHAKLDTLLGAEGAFVDALYFCPHHPDRGFENERAELKIDCECRKPKGGMIMQAVSDLNLDLEQCWVVGDTTSDIEMARRLWLKSILVGTGEGGRDGKYDTVAGFQAATLMDAVEHILMETAQ